MNIFTFLLFAWFGCGLATGLIAQGKGRGGCLWFVAGLVLGPIALLIASAISRDQVRLDQQALRRGKRKPCPYCREAIDPSASICPHCRTALTPAS